MSTIICICGNRYFSSTDHFEYDRSTWHMEFLWPHCNGIVCCCCGARAAKLTNGRRTLGIPDQLRQNNAMMQEAESANMCCAAFWCLTCCCSECGCSTAPEDRKRLYIELIEGRYAPGMPPQQQTMGGGSARAPLLNTSPRQSGPKPDPVTREAVEKLFADMRSGSGSPGQACATLARWSLSDANVAMIAELGGLEVLIETMRKHRSDKAVQGSGVHVLFKLAGNDVKIAEAGGVEVVVSAMKEVPAVQQFGCIILMKEGQDRANQAKIVEAGGLEVLLSAMREHQTDKDFDDARKAVLILLGMIVAENDALIVKMVELGGLEVLLATLRAHMDDAELRRFALMVLKDVSASSAIGVKIVELGGIEAVLAVIPEVDSDARKVKAGMQQLIASGNVQNLQAMMSKTGDVFKEQRLVCGALRNMAVNDASKVKIAKLGGLEVLLTRLKSTGPSAREASRATREVHGGTSADENEVELHVVCDALRRLTENSAVNAKIAEIGGIKALLAWMEKNDGAVGVQHPLCEALDNLVANDANSAQVAELGGREALLAKIRSHQAQALG